MRFLIAMSFLLLAGCATVPVTAKFPEAPATLMEKCDKLKIIENPEPVFSDVLRTVTLNYTQYYHCIGILNGWQQWYAEHKENFNSVSK